MHSYSIAAAYMPETDTSASPPLSITPLATTLTPPPSASLSPRASLPPSTSPSISAPDEMNWYANGTEHSSATSSQHITTHSSSTSPITPPPAKKRARTPPIDSVHETAIQAIVPLNHKDNNSKAAKHQLSDRQRRQRLRNKLSELGELLASDHHLQRSDQMSILCCSVDTLRALRAQLMQTQNMLRTREAEARIYEAEHTRLQQAHSTMLTMIQTLQSHSATSTHSIPSTIPLHSQALLPAMSGLGVSIHRCHADGTLFSVSDIFCLLTGYSESELLGRNIFGYPLYSSVYIVPTALLQPFSQLPVLDKQSDASLYEVAVLNDTSELIRLKAIDDQALAATALPATQHNIHSSVSPLLLSTEHAHTLAHAANFNPPLSITSALFCSPLLQLKSCQLLKGADYTTGPNIASAQQQAQVIQRSLVGEEFVRMLLSSPPNHCMKLLQRMQTKTGAVYEAIITITCARNEQGGLHHFVVTSAPETRRFLMQPQQQGQLALPVPNKSVHLAQLNGVQSTSAVPYTDGTTPTPIHNNNMTSNVYPTAHAMYNSTAAASPLSQAVAAANASQYTTPTTATATSTSVDDVLPLTLTQEYHNHYNRGSPIPIAD